MFKRSLRCTLKAWKNAAEILCRPRENRTVPRRLNSSVTTKDGVVLASKKQPGLREFISQSLQDIEKQKAENVEEEIPYLHKADVRGDGQKVHFEVHGCQMNVSDTEVVWAILQGAGYSRAENADTADVILIVTCAIRDRAESKIWAKLRHYRGLKRTRDEKNFPLKIGLLGCMAERLKEKVLEKERLVDLVAGPDSYKDLPRLLALTRANQKAVNVLLSLDETYADIMPVRLNQDSVTAYLSIMRGCDNMCTYCIVPFTRGRERSRPMTSILDEVRYLREQGVKEITLLGQNVNSYRDISCENHYMSSDDVNTVKGFKTVYKPKKGGVRFAELLDKVSLVDPEIRIRFTSPHPKDFPDEVLEVIKDRDNICKCIHLPAQSGNSVVLERMRRGYTREAYVDLFYHIKQLLPQVNLTTDMIVGFCGETDEQFRDTLSLLKIVRYNFVYGYGYSMREKTTAHRRYKDDVPDDVKNARLVEMMTLFRNIADEINTAKIDKQVLVLVEGNSRRSDEEFVGRSDGNTKVIIPKCEVPESPNSCITRPIKPGDYVCAQITEATSQVFKGRPLFCTTIKDYSKLQSPQEQRLRQIT